MNPDISPDINPDRPEAGMSRNPDIGGGKEYPRKGVFLPPCPGDSGSRTENPMSVSGGGFPDWFEVVLGGQAYRPVRVEPYERADGHCSVIVTWESECADCGAGFRFSEGQKFYIGQKRRCDACKAPGKRVARAKLMGGKR